MPSAPILFSGVMTQQIHIQAHKRYIRLPAHTAAPTHTQAHKDTHACPHTYSRTNTHDACALLRPISSTPLLLTMQIEVNQLLEIRKHRCQGRRTLITDFVVWYHEATNTQQSFVSYGTHTCPRLLPHQHSWYMCTPATNIVDPVTTHQTDRGLSTA